MSVNLNLLDANLGISGILQPEVSQHIPESKPLPSTALNQTGLEALFGVSTTDKFLEKALCPAIGDGTVLQPAVFSNQLKTSLEDLKDSPNAEVRSFISGELAPLLENEALLQAYSGLLVGG